MQRRSKAQQPEEEPTEGVWVVARKTAARRTWPGGVAWSLAMKQACASVASLTRLSQQHLHLPIARMALQMLQLKGQEPEEWIQLQASRRVLRDGSTTVEGEEEAEVR